MLLVWEVYNFLWLSNEITMFERYVILYGKQAVIKSALFRWLFERCVILYGKQAMAQEINDLA